MRKEYAKPMVSQVSLVPGEAVLAGCKSVYTWVGPSPSGPGVYDTCSASSCFANGS